MYFVPTYNECLWNIRSKRIMTVYGAGNILVEPNIAKVQLGVVTQSKELSVAQQENAAIMHQVITSLIEAGIHEENIQTVDFFITPQYDYVDGKQEFREFQVTHMITVMIDNINQTGNIIDMAVENGANRVSDIHFSLENAQPYYLQSLRAALEDALAKAQTIAETMQLRLDPSPIDIKEQFTSPVVSDSPQTFSLSAVSVEPGQLTIAAQVEVQFQFYS
ncbi:SIMPL domain-containing protein [Alteribacillus sp. YIM 98480]|uniref:SIMPL domain-containing protein n=1 Tax=Alteribacillus sp. YIM 98480 TaxID=2606599 RepID=UPI00131BD16C|nr:SIMPL domain-containing protein [Alteribacillus sp. YIM 98480]